MARRVHKQVKGSVRVGHLILGVSTKLMCLFSAVMFMWFMISFIDVNLHNMTPGGVSEMLAWNLFTLID